MRAIWHGEQHLIFFVAPFGLQKKLFGKTFWNKVVKKRRCERSYWRVPRCNPLKDKDIVSYRSSSPPCRRFRRVMAVYDGALASSPPCRRFRSPWPPGRGRRHRSPPCRRFRRLWRNRGELARVLRRVGGLEVPAQSSACTNDVLRRVGGLEGPHAARGDAHPVLRRVGGLEESKDWIITDESVLRRVGGLEGVGGITCESSAIDEETEAR